MDLATGTAGVLAAVAASRPTDPVRLPLLGPTGDTTPAD